MVKYLSSYGNEDEKYNNCSKYVLYGDPSLRVFGRNIPGWEYFSRLTRPPYISKSVDYDREGSEDEPYVNILQNHNNVTVNFNNSLSAEIELYDMSGRIVIAERTIESGTIIPLPNVESGVYIMVVKLSDATEFREKIFIKD